MYRGFQAAVQLSIVARSVLSHSFIDLFPVISFILFKGAAYHCFAVNIYVVCQNKICLHGCCYIPPIVQRGLVCDFCTNHKRMSCHLKMLLENVYANKGFNRIHQPLVSVESCTRTFNHLYTRNHKTDSLAKYEDQV